MVRGALLFWFYLALALIGLVYSWSYFLQYFNTADSLLPGPFLQAVMSNAASSGVAIDATLAGVVFSVMVVACARQDRVKWPVLYILTTFMIGLCVSFPLYLAFRQRSIT